MHHHKRPKWPLFSSLRFTVVIRDRRLLLLPRNDSYDATPAALNGLKTDCRANLAINYERRRVRSQDPSIKSERWWMNCSEGTCLGLFWARNCRDLRKELANTHSTQGLWNNISGPDHMYVRKVLCHPAQCWILDRSHHWFGKRIQIWNNLEFEIR